MDVPVDMWLALQVMTALIFFSAAGGKMRHWPTFEGVVANYRLLPECLIRPVAYVLPPVEAALALWLLTPWARPWGATAAAALLLLFAFAMAVNLARGRASIDCGCFQSTLTQTLRWRLVARNVLVALLLLGVAGAIAGGGAPTGGTAPAAATVSLLNGLMGGVALFLVWQGLNTLWSIVPAFRPLRAPLHAHSKE